MKKAFDQTFRDIKREVNKKVLKVPSIEQKVLDATSNEPWGPHGTLLAEIAQASRNYHEYQMTMAVIWKRVNDTGKNWRHVYKALTVLEYLVGHGSERVIDEIKEHAYQIQTLSDFQYIDSSGRDQGNNVRRKSQSLVVLVNDKERILEVRQKAAANRDKYRNASMGSMYRPGSYSSGGYGGYENDRYDGHYGSKDEDRNGYGREREWGYRDDDRYGRYGDSYRDRDWYGKDYDDRYSRDGYGDNDHRGRSRSVDGYQYGSRSRSSDRDREHAYEDDGQYSSRGSGAKADDHIQDGSSAGKRLERKFSEQNLGAPPTYEEAVDTAHSPTYGEQGREIPSASAPKSSSPPASASPGQAANAVASEPAPGSPSTTALPHPPPPLVIDQKEVDSFDEFDPRGSFSAPPTMSDVPAPPTSSSVEMDLLGSLSESFSANSLALVPSSAASVAPGTDAFGNSGSVPTFMAPSSGPSPNQTFDDPFGDGPFKATPSGDDLAAQPQNTASTSSHFPTMNQRPEPPQPVSQKAATANNFGDTFPGATYETANGSSAQSSAANMQYSQQELSPSRDIDILADILPPGRPESFAISQTTYPAPNGEPSPQAGFPPLNAQTVSQSGFSSQTSATTPETNFPTQSGFLEQPGRPPMHTSFLVQSSQLVPHSNFHTQTIQPTSLRGFPVQAGQASQTTFPSQSGHSASIAGFPSQTLSSPQAEIQAQTTQQSTNFYGSYNPQIGSTGPATPQMVPQVSSGSVVQDNSINFLPQSSSAVPANSQSSQSPHIQSSPVASQPMLPASTGSVVSASQPAKDKFETKSTVWADTLSRGLVNLNISGPKINPLSDIGVDFDAINRKEKRMEKQTPAPVTSTITMGKAMGSGSGIGRAGALRAPPNPMMGSGMGMSMGMGNMGGGPGPGMAMGGYGAPNQQMGPVMGMNMPPNIGMGMSMGMGQGGQTQQPMGFPPGSAMLRGYNPVMGTGNYGQQLYGGGYR